MNYIQDCGHVTALRYKITSNGGIQYRYQCVKCGVTVGKNAIRHEDLTDEQRRAATKYDDDLQEQKSRERWQIEKAARVAEYTEKSIEWFEAHAAYLNSPEWRRKRLLVLQRDHHTCTAKLDGCTNIAVDVHHLTYSHYRNEPLFDLASVCKHCHDIITAQDRAIHAERMQA